MSKKRTEQCLILAQKDSADPKSIENFIKGAWDEARDRAGGDEGLTNSKLIDIINEMEDAARMKAVSDEIMLSRSMSARANNSTVMQGFMATGHSRIKSLAQTVAAAGDKAILAGRRSVANFNHELIELGGLDIYLAETKNHKAILTEIGEVNKKNGKIGITGDKNAVEIAKVFQRYVDAGRAVFADNGIFVQNLEGRMLRQTFTRESLSFVGEEKFIADMLPRINRSRTFPNVKSGVGDDELKAYLSNFYKEITDGIDADVPFTNGMFDSSPTIGNKALRHRNLHLNGVDDTLHVMAQYGEGNVAGVMVNTIEQTSKNAELIDTLGPSPRNTVEFLKAEAKRGATQEERERIERPHSLKPWDNADLIMDVTDGKLHQNADTKIRLWTAAINNFVRGTMLQGVTLSALPDLGTAQAAYSRLGSSASRQADDRWNVLTGSLSKDDLKIFAGIADAQSSYHIGTMQSLVGGPGVLPKTVNLSTKYVDAVMKYGLQNWWTRQGKQAAAFGYANAIPKFSGKGWDNIEPYFRDTLLRGGITKDDWEFIRTRADSLSEDIGGHTAFVNEKILGLKDAEIKEAFGVNGADIQRTRRRLYNGMEAATKSFTDDSIVTPGVRERAVLTMGQGDGTIMGSLRAFTMSLMSYPIAYMFRAVGRDLRLGGAGAAKATAYLAAVSIFYGYASTMAHDTARGRYRDWTSDDPTIQFKNFVDASARGGLGGIFGGFVSQQVLYGETPLSSAGGAPLDIIDKTLGGLMQAGEYSLDGENEKAAAKIAKVVRPLVPFSNFPGIRVAFDNMIFYPVLEMTDPSTISKMESNWKRNTGGGYFVPPQ